MGFYRKFQERKVQTGLLCTGLDPELSKLPDSIKADKDPLFSFCATIADATAEFTTVWKPNIAFFESSGYDGIRQFENLTAYLREKYPAIPIIADVKRGDLGNTAKEYASYYFGKLKVDAITLSPYMGSDSIKPFLEFENSYVFLLCLTSNPGSAELQKQKYTSGQFLYEAVADMAEALDFHKTGIVVGATSPDELGTIRQRHPDLLFLVPGVGAQGGDASEIKRTGGENCIVSVSRSILYASAGSDFAEKAGEAARGFGLQLGLK